ncbi:MAG: hypothetical protein E6K13_06490 [Methanobacteriota archaeon]|nr:MAG: hypothetical protein E6K13_06490 [Euryarchaeota archaeon]
MRRVIALSLAIVLALLPVSRAQSDNPRDLRDVGSLIRIVSAPQLAPGEAGSFAFNLTNPYSFAMQNISLNVSIYQYTTLEETLPVDASWRWSFPRIAESTANPRELLIHPGGPLDRLGVAEHLPEQFTILTSQDMPHGSIFAQSAYYLRFWLEFDFNNVTTNTRLTMASRGYFSDAAWTNATTYNGPGCTAFNATNRCLGSVNLTRLGVDGILPDSAFGVKEPIPVWPFYGLIALTAFFLILAFLFWVEENPGQYPRIERRWLMFKGRLRRLVRLPLRKRV